MNNLKSRIDKLLISTAGNPFITSKPEDLFYFSGFTGDFGYVVLDNQKSHLITVKMFEEEAKNSVDKSLFEIHIVERKDIFPKIVDVLLEAGSEDIYICSTDTRLSGFISVVESAKDKKLFGLNKKLLSLRDDHFSIGNVKVFFKEEITQKIRAIKDAGEMEIIRNNMLLSDEGFLYILKIIKPGMTELQVSAELEYYLKSKGAEGMSFPTIVASGSRSSIPHARSSTKVISNGEPVVIDFGIKKSMYCTDTTRTIFIGQPSQKFKDTYNVVLEALNEGIAVAKAGVSVSEVDRKVRGVIERNGLGEYFIHSTGHGVGLEIHEYPYLSQWNNYELQEGMVVTIEPGVYIPGEFGIRIENMVLIGKNSCEVLTNLKTDLVSV